MFCEQDSNAAARGVWRGAGGGGRAFFVFVHSTVYIEEEKYATNCFMIISAPPPHARAR
jgi:hypothetical protein